MKECTCLTSKKCSIHPCKKHQQKYSHWFANKGTMLYVVCRYCDSIEVIPVASIPDGVYLEDFITNRFKKEV